jgi:choline dehydrogenase-like flavoprotein
MYCIIGSGPSAIAAAAGLVKKNKEIAIIDTGINLEKNNTILKEKLASTEPDQWHEEDIETLKSSMKSTVKGIPKKIVYGSDYVYRQIENGGQLFLSNAKMVRSFATGGLSNVWGACILPYSTDELSDWPISPEELLPHYKAILDFMPHVGREDNLRLRLPMYSERYSQLNLSRQIDLFLKDLEANQKSLNEQKVYFGASRLAVNHNNGAGSAGCRYCGLCLYGCPYDLIYSSRTTLDQLMMQNKVRYLPGYAVERLEERPGEVIIYARCLQANCITKFRAAKVFVAAGVIESTRIILESLEAYERPVTVKHSDRFLLPFVRFKGIPHIYDENVNTLCQAFIEISGMKSCLRSVHLQAYAYSDLYRRTLETRLGCMAGMMEYPMRKFLERLIILFGYIHSDVSSHLTLRVTKSAERKLFIEGFRNKQAKKVAKEVLWKLWMNVQNFRGIPLLAFLDPPGGGNHTGGTFPMREHPAEFESDKYGIPYGFARVHLVDASVFPSLAATTVTLPIMANAHRIATACEG